MKIPYKYIVKIKNILNDNENCDVKVYVIKYSYHLEYKIDKAFILHSPTNLVQLDTDSTLL